MKIISILKSTDCQQKRRDSLLVDYVIQNVQKGMQHSSVQMEGYGEK